MPSQVPLLTPAASNGSTLKADVRTKTLRGSLPVPHGKVSLSYIECPACHRNFEVDAIGAIPRHAQKGYRPTNSLTAPVCAGARLILLE